MTIVTHSVHTKGIHVLTCSPDAGMMLTELQTHTKSQTLSENLCGPNITKSPLIFFYL